MRVFVINRPEDVERRTIARQKLEAAGIRFEFFDAISGDSAVERRLFEDFDADEFMLNTSRTVTPGEIGCFASHRALWERTVDLKEPIMVMEDDFDLLDSFPDAFDSARAAIDSLGFLRLQTERRARKRPVGTLDQFLVSQYTKAPHCTMCYCITPSVARRFIDRTRVFTAPVDIFVRNFWEHGQPLFALTPYAVAPSVLSATPTILGRDKGRKHLIPAARRSLRKARDYWRRWVFNVRQRYSPTTALRILERGELPGVRDERHRNAKAADGADKATKAECESL